MLKSYERLKIAVFCPALYAEGGVPYETRSLMAALQHQGCEVLSIARAQEERKQFRDRKQIIENFERSDDELTCDRRLYHNIFVSMPGIIRGIKSFAPDICFVIGARMPEIAFFSFCMKFAGLKYIVFAHGLYSAELLAHKWGGGRKTPFIRMLESCYLSFVDLPYMRNGVGTRALSRSEQSSLQALGGRNVFIVPDGIDKSWIRRSEGERVFNSSKPIRLLYLGRLDEYQKGLDIVLAAFNLEQLSTKFEVIIAGPGHERYLALAKQKVHEWLPPCIKILGPAFGKEKDRLIEWADFFLHTSRYEGMAKAPREALGAGVPLIASFQSNFGDWVRDFCMGIAVNANAESVSAALLELQFLSPSMYSQMRKNALEFARKYSWDTVAQETIDQIQLLRAAVSVANGSQ
jgi:glycosyltransferase involved in cell wall biosynthesis